MAEVLLALTDGGDLSALVEHLPDNLLGGVLRQTSHEHRLTAGRTLACRGRGQVWRAESTQWAETLLTSVVTSAQNKHDGQQAEDFYRSEVRCRN